MDVVANEKLEKKKKEEVKEEGGRKEEGRKEATNIKSNNPHLAGGERGPATYTKRLHQAFRR